MSDWSETRAAVSRLKASWRDLQEARRKSRELDRLARARAMVLRALEIHPDALKPVVERVTETTMDVLFKRGLIDIERVMRQRTREG